MEESWTHLLVEEDPEEIRRRGEELFPHAELAGGEADASVDGSRRAARGRDLTQKIKGMVRPELGLWLRMNRATE